MNNKIRDKTIQDLLLLFHNKINECIDNIEEQNKKLNEIKTEGFEDYINIQIDEIINSDKFITDGGEF